MSVAALITRRRLLKVGGFASAQLVVQVLGFASGIALVQFMEPTQYGHYTLAVSMVGLASVLLDLGLSTAVLAQGGPLHDDPGALGGLVADAFVIQRLLMLLGALVLAPVFGAMFIRQGLAWPEMLVLTVLALGCGAFNVHNAVSMSLVRLRGDLAMQQRTDVGVNAARALLVVAAGLIWLDARVAVALNLAAAVGVFALLKSYLARHVDHSPVAAGKHRAGLWDFIRRQAPNSIYYCVLGQISVWLVGLFGSVERVAEVGALGRLAALFTVIGAVLGAMVVPYFARASSAREMASAFGALNGFFALLSAVLVAASLVFPHALLWILGRQYSGLVHELPWMVLASSLSAWTAGLYGVGAARGWIVPAVLMIPLGIATVALAAFVLDMSSVSGVFMMNSAVALVSLVLTFGMVYVQLRSLGPGPSGTKEHP